MNLERIISRFTLISGASDETVSQWMAVIGDAAGHIESVATVENPDEDQRRRLDVLAAVYANYLYCLYSQSTIEDGSVTSFKAGDVQVSVGKSDVVNTAEKLWTRAMAENSDIIGADGFYFGSVKA